MDTDPENKNGYVDEKADVDAEHRNDSVYAEKAGVADFKAAAIEAENEEHNMTVLQAVKAYPMASFWAFVMSCTIVSCHPAVHTMGEVLGLIPLRSWNPTMSS
jgi:MFS transporter, SP family, general alpha glucoside:H+ symporter